MLEGLLFGTRVGERMMEWLERVTGMAVLVEDGWRLRFVPAALLGRLRCGRPVPKS